VLVRLEIQDLLVTLALLETLVLQEIQQHLAQFLRLLALLVVLVAPVDLEEIVVLVAQLEIQAVPEMLVIPEIMGLVVMVDLVDLLAVPLL
jgi:hypothetical protein